MKYSYSDEIRNRLTKDGYSIDKPVGCGTQGCAFPIKERPNRILKITEDKSEAATMSIFIGKNFKNIVNVFDVWSYPKIDSKTYFIEEEREETVPRS
jgi:hypothetical protein